MIGGEWDLWPFRLLQMKAAICISRNSSIHNQQANHGLGYA